MSGVALAVGVVRDPHGFLTRPGRNIFGGYFGSACPVLGNSMAREPLYPGEETVPFSIRIPQSLKDYLQERARQNRRSMNQEVVLLIEQALAQEHAQADAQSSH